MKQKKIKCEEELIEETTKFFEVTKLVEFKQDILEIKNLLGLDEQITNPEGIYKKIKYIYEKTKLNICPVGQLKTAKQFVKKWKRDFNKASKEEDEKFNSKMKGLDKFRKRLDGKSTPS